MSDVDDPYAILGLEAGADEQAVNKAYRALAMKFHPDREGGSYEAFDRLSNAKEAILDILDEDSESSTSRPGQDHFVTVNLPLSLAIFGGKFLFKAEELAQCGACGGSGRYKFKVPQNCSNCHGTGQLKATKGIIQVEIPCSVCKNAGMVADTQCMDCGGTGRGAGFGSIEIDVPPGIRSGEAIVIENKGEPGTGGCPPGALVLHVDLHNEKGFSRKGDDLLKAVSVPVSDLLLGCTYSMPCLDGKHVDINIPELTRPGTIFTVEGRGFTVFGGVKRGNLLVKIGAKYPDELTPRAKKLISSLKDDGI